MQSIWFNQPKLDFFLNQPLNLKFVCLGTECVFMWEKNRVNLLFTLQEVFGYQTQNLHRALCLITSVLTCGVLLLLFYWKPQWRVWANCIPCSLQEADTILLRTTVRVLLCFIYCTACDGQHSRVDPPLFKFPCPQIGDGKTISAVYLLCLILSQEWRAFPPHQPGEISTMSGSLWEPLAITWAVAVRVITLKDITWEWLFSFSEICILRKLYILNIKVWF